jgi:hypothetical protein
MAKASYEYCPIGDIRYEVELRLKLPSYTGKGQETPTAFWSRVEEAGLLPEALALYDQVAAEEQARRRIRQETKREFLERVEREGRQAEADRLRAELLASGLSQREAQAQLVRRMQPLDGSQTRAWETPDPWDNGRLFLRKADQQHLLDLVEEDDDCLDDQEQVREQARNRVEWAQRRQDERQALAAARRRLEALKQPGAQKTDAPKQEALRCVPAVSPKPSADRQGLALSAVGEDEWEVL